MQNSFIKVDLIDSMGTDHSVVNAARVSMSKFKNKEDAWDESDTKLIKYLAKHNHFSPFTHAVAQFRVKAPIFVERQIFKHVVGFSYNSLSLRYCEPTDEVFMPDMRKGSASIKQGSLSEEVSEPQHHRELAQQSMEYSFNTYHRLVDAGIAKEVARAVLPMATMTEFIVTGSLYAFARMHGLRSKPDAQRETQIYARLIGNHMQRLFPVSWSVLTENESA